MFFASRPRDTPQVPAATPPVAAPADIEAPPAPLPAPVATAKPAPAPVTPKTIVSNKRPVASTARPVPESPIAPPRVIPAQPLPPPPPPPQEWNGNSDTAVKRSGQIVVQNEKQWIRFWAEHHPGEVSPDVDFSRRMVVGVFLGRRPADTFSVEIAGVRTLSDALAVDYVERAPPPGTFQMAVEVYPYAIKAVPRSTLPVKFNKLPAEYRPDTSIPRSTATTP
jgi:hypothetical protein